MEQRYEEDDDAWACDVPPGGGGEPEHERNESPQPPRGGSWRKACRQRATQLAKESGKPEEDPSRNQGDPPKATNQGDPKANKLDSQTLQSYPQTKKTPKTMEKPPQTTQGDPRTTQGDPKTTQGDPKTAQGVNGTKTKASGFSSDGSNTAEKGSGGMSPPCIRPVYPNTAEPLGGGGDSERQLNGGQPPSRGGSWRIACRQKAPPVKEAGKPAKKPTEEAGKPTAMFGKPANKPTEEAAKPTKEAGKLAKEAGKLEKDPSKNHGHPAKATNQADHKTMQTGTRASKSDSDTMQVAGQHWRPNTIDGGPTAMQRGLKILHEDPITNLGYAPKIMQLAPNTKQTLPGTMEKYPKTKENLKTIQKHPQNVHSRPETVQWGPKTNQGVNGTITGISVFSSGFPNTAQKGSYGMSPSCIRQVYPYTAKENTYIAQRGPNTMQGVPTYPSQGYHAATENPYLWTSAPNTKQGTPAYHSQGYAAQENSYVWPRAPNTMQGAPTYRSLQDPLTAYSPTAEWSANIMQMGCSITGHPNTNQGYPCTAEKYLYMAPMGPDNAEGAFCRTEGFRPIDQKYPQLSQGPNASGFFDHQRPDACRTAMHSNTGDTESCLEYNKEMHTSLLGRDLREQLSKRQNSHLSPSPLRRDGSRSPSISHSSLKRRSLSPHSQNHNSMDRKSLSPRSTRSRNFSRTNRTVRSLSSSPSRHSSPLKRSSRSPRSSRSRHRSPPKRASRSPRSPRYRHHSPMKRTSRSPRSPRSRHRSPLKRASRSPRSPRSRHHSPMKRTSRSPRSPRSRHRSPLKRTSRSPRSPRSRHRSPLKRASRSPRSPRSRHRSPLKRTSRSPRSPRSRRRSPLRRSSRSSRSPRPRHRSPLNRAIWSPRSSRSRTRSTSVPRSTESPCLENEPQKCFGVRVDIATKFPDDKTLKEVIFGRFVKFGLVNSVEVHHSLEGRYALVFFDQPHEQQEALIGAPKMRLYSQTLEVTPWTSWKVEGDCTDNIWDDEMVQFNPISTRTLLISNLSKTIAPEKLDDICMQFDDILDIEIQPTPGKDTCSALVEFCNITSLVKARKALDSEFFGTSKVKVTFAKSVPTNCLWLDGLPSNLTVDYLILRFSEYGPVAKMVYDCMRGMALVRYKHDKDAITAMKELKCGMGKISGHRVMVDFVSDRTQLAFCQSMKASGQDIGDFLSD